MKKILLFLVLLVPFNVMGLTLEEMPPFISTTNLCDGCTINKTITNDSVIVEVVESNGQSYTWCFDKDKVGEYIELNFEIDFDSSVKDKIDILTDNIDKTYISFNHHGSLPSNALITVDVSDKYSDGKKLYLYYYDEYKDIISLITNDVLVTDGLVTFEIEHCSDYFLTATIVNDKKTAVNDFNYVIVVMVVVVFGLVGFTLFSNKK